jgi:nucleotide-binding universal stress UspA family protein
VKILVTLDGSHFSEAILGAVAALAAPLDAEVELLAVGQPERAQGTLARATYVEMTPAATATGTRLGVPAAAELLGPPAESRAQALARVEASLRDYLTLRAHELEGVRVQTRVEFADDVAEAIVQRARDTRPDLIAMATHGRSGLSHLLAGSVCERVIRSGVAPVLVLRP